VEATANVTVELPEPGAAIDVGLKLTVTPVGWPVAVSATAPLNPPETVLVTLLVPFEPCATETEVGEAEIAKAGAAVTVRATVEVFVVPPPVPVTVIVYVPGAVVEATVMVSVELPEPGAAMDEGLKLSVTPDG